MARSIKNLIAAILIAVSCYLAWTEVLPDYSVISYLKDQITEKQDLLASRAEIIQKIQKLRDESSSKYTELQRLALVIPDKKSFPELITAVENIYSRNGFILPQIGLGDSKEPDQVGKIGIKADAAGTYTEFLNFLNHFERNIRLFDVNAINIGLESDALSLENQNPDLNFSITGNFYWLRDISSDTPEEGAVGQDNDQE